MSCVPYNKYEINYLLSKRKGLLEGGDSGFNKYIASSDYGNNSSASQREESSKRVDVSQDIIYK